MSASDTAKRNYEKAKDESILRVQIRDQVLLAFLAATGTLFGIALGSANAYEVLLIMPYLALGASIIVSQHNSMIGAIGSFIAEETTTFLKEREEEEAPLWENSAALADYSSNMILSRSFGHFILLISPAIAGLAMNHIHIFQSSFPYGPAWWTGMISTTLAIYVLLRSHLFRKKLHKRRL
jgi:hypothetical protein